LSSFCSQSVQAFSAHGCILACTAAQTRACENRVRIDADSAAKD
jgi:hypothetical protein